MMGLFGQTASKLTRPRGTSLEDKMPEDTEPDDTSILFVFFLLFLPISCHRYVSVHV